MMFSLLLCRHYLELESSFKLANHATPAIVNDLMSIAREDAWREVKSLRNRIEKLLKTKTKPIIEQAQRRLSKQFNVTLELPDMFDELYLEDVSLDIQAKSRSREYTEYKTVKERHWYTSNSHYGNFDLIWL